MPAGPARRPLASRPGLAVFLLFLGLYLFFLGRWPPTADAIPLWEVAHNLVTKQTIAVETQWNLPPSPDGKIYAMLPLLCSLVHVPGAAARVLVEQIFPGTAPMTLPLFARIGPAALGAATCALFYALARRFVGGRAAALSTAFVGLGTGVLYYARLPYTEILQTFCFTGFILATVDALADPSAKNGRRLGLWVGLLINSKLLFALVVPGVALVLAWQHRRQPRRLVELFVWAGLLLAITAIPLAWYNWARFGSIFATGYGPTGRGTTWRGVWGLLFSPGKSVFLYDPPMLLVVAGLPMLVRRHLAFSLALAAAIVPVFLFYAQFMYWDGDWAWGPRYLTPFLPALCVALALFVEEAMRAARRLRLALIAAALAAGIGIQALGAVFSWDHWITIAINATTEWLRPPACDGPPPPEGACWPDGKILYAMQWLPSLQPIAGHLWLARHIPFRHPYRVAELDAPWQWEGKIHIPALEKYYRETLIDWWAFGWLSHPRATVVVCALMILIFLSGLVLVWRQLRAARRAGG